MYIQFKLNLSSIWEGYLFQEIFWEWSLLRISLVAAPKHNCSLQICKGRSNAPSSSSNIFKTNVVLEMFDVLDRLVQNFIFGYAQRVLQSLLVNKQTVLTVFCLCSTCTLSFHFIFTSFRRVTLQFSWFSRGPPLKRKNIYTTKIQ